VNPKKKDLCTMSQMVSKNMKITIPSTTLFNRLMEAGMALLCSPCLNASKAFEN